VFPIEYVVVARHAQNNRDAPAVRRTAPDGKLIPVPPEHLFQPGRGTTLCGVAVDETWQRFGSQGGLLSLQACGQCRQIREATPA
jgi:hypothetical protein